MSAIELVGGLDIGNGCVKGGLWTKGGQTQNVDFPAGVVISSPDNFIAVLEQDAGDVIADIYNQMNVSFDSQAVRSDNTYWFGMRANNSGQHVEEFSVQNTKSKAENKLSAILVLGSLAGRALQEYWAMHRKLPDNVLEASVCVGLALPISEYANYHKRYARMFMEASHMVCFQNFDKPVRVCLKFDDVRVMPEGASAQYAISARGKDFMELLLKDCRAHGAPLDCVTGEDMLALKNVVGIDIGEGTVNFPVFKNGQFNSDASKTLLEGYGNMLENCLEPLANANILSFDSRKRLASYLLENAEGGLPTKRATYNKVQAVVAKQRGIFAQVIISKFEEVMRRVGADVDVVYVYGGGATDLKEVLYPMLLDRSRDFGGGTDLGYPVMYLDSVYSRYLNREGLMLIARTAAEQRDRAMQAQTAKGSVTPKQ